MIRRVELRTWAHADAIAPQITNPESAPQVWLGSPDLLTTENARAWVIEASLDSIEGWPWLERVGLQSRTPRNATEGERVAAFLAWARPGLTTIQACKIFDIGILGPGIAGAWFGDVMPIGEPPSVLASPFPAPLGARGTDVGSGWRSLRAPTYLGSPRCSLSLYAIVLAPIIAADPPYTPFNAWAWQLSAEFTWRPETEGMI